MLDLELTALGAEVKKRKAEGRLSQTGQLPCLVVRPGLEINEALAIGRRVVPFVPRPPPLPPGA